MAKNPSPGNGGDKQADGGGETAEVTAQTQSQTGAAPTLNVLAQYVKDLSFENPNAPQSLASAGQSPTIQININVNARTLSETDYEVELKLDAKAAKDEKVVFNVELSYAGIFRVQNVPKESLQAVMLIECPRILFPFARQILATASRDGGFPPLMVDPVDFAALYRQRVAEPTGTAEA